MFKAPVGWRMRARKGGIAKDIVSTLYEDESRELFEEVPYVELEENAEIVGVYGYY